MLRVKNLLHKKIYKKDNTFLGHVFNIKLHPVYRGKVLDSIEIVSLLYGQQGFLERLGFIKPLPKEIMWKDVVGIEGDKIIIK